MHAHSNYKIKISGTKEELNAVAEVLINALMILVTPGQQSCNTRTRFLDYPDTVLVTSGQHS